jgi:pyruvate-formate lyase-activating enzyme
MGAKWLIMRPTVLLVNPPIYDFTAYDFWLRPYGMLRVAGRLQHACALSGFDFLVSEPRDAWGRGRYREEIVSRPGHFRDIPRRFRRFGRSREEFRHFLKECRVDAALVQTGMTYWYEGVREVLEDLRKLQPQAKTILGGTYAGLCPDHARSLGADLVIEGTDFEPLRRMLGISLADSLPLWNGFVRGVGIVKLTEGCPFRCTYCSVPVMSADFRVRPTGECLEEVIYLAQLGARHIAFYDDALLFRASEGIIPFLAAAGRERLDISFHTPNALNARFLTPELARLMVGSGVQNFFLGLECTSSEWQAATGGKVRSQEFSEAVTSLKRAGAQFITAYIIAGHPDSEPAQVEDSMRFAHELGVRIMLAEFAPIPGTPDGERCREWVEIDEPLSHNKTAFTIRRLGADRINQLKSLCRELNSNFRP